MSPRHIIKISSCKEQRGPLFVKQIGDLAAVLKSMGVIETSKCSHFNPSMLCLTDVSSKSIVHSYVPQAEAWEIMHYM